ncbi:MAG TPA: FtsL-like putative cell division protein [Bacteroidales bacterium]|nr:FtsL-like putative cell division protein [Bacteroidales bacterium]
MKRNNNDIELTYESDFLPEPNETEGSQDEFTSTAPADKAEKEAPPEPKRKKVRVKEIIDGTFLVRENMIRQLPYVLFLTFLGILYIANRFHAERMVRQIDELKVEVDNLRSEQITTTSELMNISRPSQVSALVQSKGLGLKESMEPPKKLKR